MGETENIAVRLAACTEAIIAERVREARRECYNAVCEQFDGSNDHDKGVTACRDAIAKLIEGETP